MPQGAVEDGHPTALEQQQLVKALKDALRRLVDGACAIQHGTDGHDLIALGTAGLHRVLSDCTGR